MAVRLKTAPALAIGGLLTMPLVVALVALHGRALAPVFDFAIIEERVRDVFTQHTPLLGPAGRLGSFAKPASHPGPILYYLLAPVYRLLGGSAWALRVSSVSIHIGAIATALWLAQRRGGTAWAVGVGAALAWLMQGYGLTLLTSAWNPYLPVLWFLVFLMAAWSVLCGDTAIFPVAAGSGSLCAQAHISYVPVCSVVGIALVVAMGSEIHAAPHGSDARRRAMRWLLIGAVGTVVLWLPPMIEQLTTSPGNISALVTYFGTETAAPVGFVGALSLVAMRLDPWNLVVEQLGTPGGFETPLPVPEPQAWRGAASVGLWLLCAVFSLRARRKPLQVLHAVLAIGLFVGLVTVSRIFRGLWQHLVLWVWVFGALLVVASAASIACCAPRITAKWPRLNPVAPWLGVALVAVSSVRLTWAAVDFRPRGYALNEQLSALVPGVMNAIDARDRMMGHKGRYVVTWDDGFYFGSQAIGLANELERAGYDVGLEPHLSFLGGAHRTIPRAEAVARLHFANGGWIERWERFPGAFEAARADLRTSRQRAEYATLRKRIVGSLLASGRRDLVASLEYGTPALPPGLPPDLDVWLSLRASIGVPAAVFIVPPDAALPPEK